MIGRSAAFFIGWNMKTGTLELQISVKLKWWVSPYIPTLKLFCLTLGIDPNYDKVGEFIAKHGLITTKHITTR